MCIARFSAIRGDRDAGATAVTQPRMTHVSSNCNLGVIAQGIVIRMITAIHPNNIASPRSARASPERDRQNQSTTPSPPADTTVMNSSRSTIAVLSRYRKQTVMYLLYLAIRRGQGVRAAPTMRGNLP